MSVSRREFLKYGGAVTTGVIGDGFLRGSLNPVSDSISTLSEGPIHCLEPTDESGHSITRDSSGYVLEKTWPSYFTPFRFTIRSEIPHKSIESMPDTQLRNPFHVYEKSLNSEVAESTAITLDEGVKVVYREAGNKYVGDINSILIPEIARYVQHIKYVDDADVEGTFVDYAQYPTETLYLGFGDCEDSAILFTSLVENLESINVRSGLAFASNHLFSILAIPDLPQSNKYETYTHIDGVPFTVIDTATPNPVYSTPETIPWDHTLVFIDGEFKSINYQKIPGSVADVIRNVF